MAFATASSPANRKPGDNTQTATPPQAQARPRQSSGKAEPRARQDPPARTRPPSVPDPTSACQSPRARQDRQRAPGPPRAPGRKPGSGALAGPSSGLRGANRAEQRVPRALAGPSSELPLRRIANFVQPWSKETILRRLRAKTHDSSRYRKPIREQPTKTSVSHFRDRENRLF